jgi:hypothetical protein
MLALECQLLLEGNPNNSGTKCYVQRAGISYIKGGIFFIKTGVLISP